jgi:hypothetical protein
MAAQKDLFAYVEEERAHPEADGLDPSQSA